MKLLLTLLLTSIVQSAPIQLLNRHDWITFAPKTGDFSVRLPGQPTESLEHMDFNSTKIELVRFSYLKNDVGFFVVRIGDLPEELVTNGYLEFLFENAYKKLLGYKTREGKSSTLKSSRKAIRLAEYPGYQYKSACGPYKKIIGPCDSILRVFKVNRRIYLIGLAGPKAQLSQNSVNEFFLSFRVLNSGEHNKPCS